MDSKQEVPPRRSVVGIAFSGGLSMLFFSVGTAFLLEAPVTIYRQEAAWHWPKAPGQILSVSHSVRAGTGVKYSYLWEGRFYEDSTGNLPHINRTQLKAGNKVQVRFDPKKPKISVLDPGFPLGSVFEFLYGVFFWMWSGIMATLCVSSYRDPANNVWSFGWKRRRHPRKIESQHGLGSRKRR